MSCSKKIDIAYDNSSFEKVKKNREITQLPLFDLLDIWQHIRIQQN